MPGVLRWLMGLGDKKVDKARQQSPAGSERNRLYDYFGKIYNDQLDPDDRVVKSHKKLYGEGAKVGQGEKGYVPVSKGYTLSTEEGDSDDERAVSLRPKSKDYKEDVNLSDKDDDKEFRNMYKKLLLRERKKSY